LVSLLYPNEANKPGYGQLYILIVLKQQQNLLKTNITNCMDKVIKHMGKMLLQVSLFAESYEQMHEMQ
jgi:hypothetical protein